MSSLPPDPWKALGVDKTADKSEIRTAYKKLVLKCHPDKVQDPTLKAQKQEEFQKVQQAYELLNNDAERTKYEEQVKIMELRKQAAMMKNMPNSSATRTPPRAYEIRTAEPRHKGSTPSSGVKVYPYNQSHSRSHEEMPSRGYQMFDETEKHPRRTTSYEKPTRREDERRDKDKDKDDRRRSKREDEDGFRIRENNREKELQREIRDREEKEREREARRAERKRNERDQKEREKERLRATDDKARRQKSPYIEDYEAAAEEARFANASKQEKKRSGSKKPYEAREREREREPVVREKSTTSRCDPSPHVETVQPPPAVPPAPDQKLADHLFNAANYIERSRGAPPAVAFSRSQQEGFFTPPVPTPPPVEFDDDRRASARVAGRRSSHEASKSKEKLSSSHSSSHKNFSDMMEAAALPPKIRTVPSLSKSTTSPPLVPESPPRVSRTSTSEFPRPIPQPPAFSRTQTWTAGSEDVRLNPTFSRTQTWGAGGEERHHEYFDQDGNSDDDRGHRHSRRSGRRAARSPEQAVRYKVADGKSSRVDAQYPYDEPPTSRRAYAHDGIDSRSPGTYPSHLKVAESKAYGYHDVKYADTSYGYSSHDQYPPVYA
ncbi:hypothetical protein B0T25DRAFT_114242 [Lasiosphaeria hispida]|uniref:J domain-containing protein n=1 Tax=Lasiosphaeria hispida TaxID=260671 RepID=A0AAJ0HR31_9PEZI|nr:hypothetical protein B0T25DRAFT_114242 [Lasiosphaeria hispida]